MISGGQIYHLTNFQQSDNSQPKNRYCVVLAVIADDSVIIFHKVTSVPYCDDQLEKGGNTVNEKMDVFFFPKDWVIGVNGFQFSQDSYIHMGVWNISEMTIEKFQAFEHEYLDTLTSDVYNELLYFVYKSEHNRQKFEVVFEPILEKLNSGDS